MSEQLFCKNDIGEELPINSNEEEFCLECGVTITKENDSGWERFRPDGITTQKICKICDAKPLPAEKSEE